MVRELGGRGGVVEGERVAVHERKQLFYSPIQAPQGNLLILFPWDMGCWHRTSTLEISAYAPGLLGIGKIGDVQWILPFSYIQLLIFCQQNSDSEV